MSSRRRPSNKTHADLDPDYVEHQRLRLDAARKRAGISRRQLDLALEVIGYPGGYEGYCSARTGAALDAVERLEKVLLARLEQHQQLHRVLDPRSAEGRRQAAAVCDVLSSTCTAAAGVLAEDVAAAAVLREDARLCVRISKQIEFRRARAFTAPMIGKLHNVSSFAIELRERGLEDEDIALLRVAHAHGGVLPEQPQALKTKLDRAQGALRIAVHKRNKRGGGKGKFSMAETVEGVWRRVEERRPPTFKSR